MLSKGRIAGGGALLLAPIIVIAANLVRPTLSDDAATQVTAFTDHRGAMIAGIALSAIGVVIGLIEVVRTLVASRGEQTAAKTVAGTVATAGGSFR